MCVVLSVTEFRTDSATADPTLVKERSIALRRRVSSRPPLIDSSRNGLVASSTYTPSGFVAHVATILAMFALTCT